MMQSRSQEFLAVAYDDVSRVRGIGGVDQDRYDSLCHKVPVMIRTCGLCQTISFLESKAKGENADKLLLGHIAARLGQQPGGLAKYVADLPTGEYVLQTRRLLEALVYYKRFAESVLKGGS